MLDFCLTEVDIFRKRFSCSDVRKWNSEMKTWSVPNRVQMESTSIETQRRINSRCGLVIIDQYSECNEVISLHLEQRLISSIRKIRSRPQCRSYCFLSPQITLAKQADASKHDIESITQICHTFFMNNALMGEILQAKFSVWLLFRFSPTVMLIQLLNITNHDFVFPHKSVLRSTVWEMIISKPLQSPLPFGRWTTISGISPRGFSLHEISLKLMSRLPLKEWHTRFVHSTNTTVQHIMLWYQ